MLDVRAQGFEFGRVDEIAENQKTLLFESLSMDIEETSVWICW